MYVKLDRDYEVKTTLGTIREIERAFNRPFFELVKDLTKMKTEEQIKLIYIGARKADPELREKVFMDACEEYMGIGDLMEYLEKYFYALQYPGLGEEEVRDRLEKKLRQNRELQKDNFTIGA